MAPKSVWFALLAFLLIVQRSSGDSNSLPGQVQPNTVEEQANEQQLVDEINQKLTNEEKTDDQGQSTTDESKSNRSTEQENNDAIKYQVAWVAELSNRDEAQKDDRLFQIAVNANDKYTCISPKVTSREEQLRHLLYEHRDLNPVRLMEHLITPDQCVMRLDHYWTYMICHGMYVTQFHEDSKGKVTTQVYILGKYNEAEMVRSRDEFKSRIEQLWQDKDRLVPTVTVNGLQLPYVEWTFTDGHVCDLNNRPRTTRIKYVCSLNKKKQFWSLKEVATCQYEAIVALPVLCNNPAFAASDVSKIECAPDSPETSQYPTNYFDYHKKDQLTQLESIFDRKRFVFTNAAGLKPNFEFEFKSLAVDETEDGTYVVKFNEPDETLTLTSVEPKVSINAQLHGNALQSFLAGDMCFTGGSGWWKYEFCYGKHVKQFHEENGKKGATILLGLWDLQRHKQHLEQNVSKQQAVSPTRNHIVHFYSQGDYCESVKGPRTTDVKLKCTEASSEMGSDSVQLYLIETNVCEYTLVFMSPMVCQLIQKADQFALMDDKLPFIVQPAP
jgi:endoplasmic reticulum lectin 1